MALSRDALEHAARLILAGRLQPPTPIGHLPTDCRPQDVDDALAVQEVLHGLLSQHGFGPVVGTKIGCTTRVMQDYLGVPHPVTGGIFQTTVHHGAGELDFDSFLHVGVECEIAVILGAPIEADRAPHSVESVAPSVEAVFPAIEVVDDRYVNFEAREPDWQTWVADDFFGSAIVLGEAATDWRSVDLAAARGTMKTNGAERGTGHGRDIINGHPLEALAWLANSEARRGRDLPAGWIVMLGSVVQTKWVEKGDEVVVEIENLGRTSARFA